MDDELWEVNLGSKDEAEGPLVPVDLGPRTWILLYAARGWSQGRPIDAITGRHGWSHMALDLDEQDRTTGRRLIVDHTVGVGVHRRFADTAHYAGRPFARVELPSSLAREVRSAAKRRVGAPYRTLSAFRHPGAGDASGTVCSQLVYECLPPDIQRAVLGVTLALGRVGNLLRRGSPYIATPNHFAVALQLPPVADVGPNGIEVPPDVVATRLAELGSRRFGLLEAPPRGCHVRAVLAVIRLGEGSDDLGNNWRFDVDVNGRGPNTVRSLRLSLADPTLTPRKIVYDEYLPPCNGSIPLSVAIDVTQYDGVNDHGEVVSPPTLAMDCPGTDLHEFTVPVDGSHEHADVTLRLITSANHVD